MVFRFYKKKNDTNYFRVELWMQTTSKKFTEFENLDEIKELQKLEFDDKILNSVEMLTFTIDDYFISQKKYFSQEQKLKNESMKKIIKNDCENYRRI